MQTNHLSQIIFVIENKIAKEISVRAGAIERQINP